jgi:peptidoglycan/LPS O-acetylase OafA/YrhL
VGAALVSSLVILLLIFDKYGSGSIGSNIATLGIFRCVAEFILGIVIFKLYQSGFIDNINWKTLAFCWSTLVMVIFIGLPDYYYLPLLIFFSILGFVKFEKDSEVNIGAFLNWLGIVSYSIYLCHYLIKDVLKLILETEYTPIWWLILYIVLTLIMSHFMYNYVEVRGVKLFEKLKR